VAVNGVCLTASCVDRPAGLLAADLMPETVHRSSLGALRAGDPVNLERPATPTSRLGGHLVQGHVDGVGWILIRTAQARSESVRIGLPPGLTRYVVSKGSIAVDGVSLTVAAVDDHSFTAGLIPATLQSTTLGDKRVGDPVNLEVDVLAKYVERLLAQAG
jgi:riboflavin synthase